MTELVSDVPISDAVGALAPSEALPVDDVSNAVTQIKQQRDLSLKGSLNQAVTIDPDKAAKNQALADKTGVPIDVINRNEEAIQQRSRANDLRALVSTSPILEQQMMNPQFAALAHDDAENLNIFERTLRTYLGASTKSGLEQLLGVGAKLLDVATQGIGIGTNEQEGAVLFKGQPAELKKFQEGPAMFLTRFTKAMQEASTLSMKNLSPAAQLEYGDLRYATLESSKAAYLSPIKVVGDAIQSLPTSLALGVSVYLTKGVAARVEAAALADGLSPTLAREAAIHAGAETMARLGAATEGAAGYGQQYMQTRQQADEVTDEQLQQSPQYQQLVAAGYSPEAARLRLSAVAAETSGAAGGAIDAITNYFGGRFLGTILTEGGHVAARTAKGFATEALTEAVQSGGEQLAQNVAVQHYLNPAQETLDQVAENIAQGFVVGGVTGGAFSAVAGAKYRQEAATHDAAVLTKLSELAANSELRARAPETFAQFVNAATADGPVEAVWIDAKGFAQSMVKAGMDEAQLAQKMPETAAALSDALATNGKVRIPTGEFMATFPGTGIEKELIQQLSTTPEGPTAAEAHDAAFIEDSKRQVENILGKKEFTDTISESAANVERELLAQANKANRFTKDVNAAMVKPLAAFFKVYSQHIWNPETGQRGITPEQMYVKYPINIGAESVVAPGTLNQPRSPTAVGYWEGPGGEHAETDHVPTFAERAVELGQHDRRWHRYPNAPAVFKSNRHGDLAQQENKTALTEFTEGSKVTGIMYHGTASDITEPSGMTWLAYDAKTAALYADRAAYDEAQQEKPDDERIDINEYNPKYEGVVQGGQNIMPVVVSAKNPLDLRDLGGSSNLRDVFAELQKKGVVPADENVQDAEDFIDNPDATSVYQLLEELNVYDDVKKKGYDSVIITDVDTTGNYHDSVGVFEPTQIKSAIGNRGTFDSNDPNILHQSAADLYPNGNPIFYSQLQRSVEALKITTAPAEEWKKAINSLMSKGVKKAEIEVSGVLDWLDTQLDREKDQWGLMAPPVAGETQGQVLSAGNDEQKARWMKNQLVTERGYTVVPLPADFQQGRITKDEVLAYLHSDGETEVRTAIFKGTEQYLPVPANVVDAEAAARAARIADLTAQRDTIDEGDEEPTFTESDVEELAERNWREQLPREAEEYADSSEYIEYDVELKTPNYKVVELPADMLRGGKKKYGIRKLDYGNTNDITDVADLGQPRESWLAGEFDSVEDAEHFIGGSRGEELLGAPAYDGESGYVGVFSKAERETEVHDTQRAAEKEADDIRGELYDNEVETYIENASFSESSPEHYMREARQELIADRGENEGSLRRDNIDRQIRQLQRGQGPVPRITNKTRLRHPDSYQLPGGKEQAELIVWVPGIEPYAAGDTTHFGDVGQGRAIAWARLSQFDDANGKPVLMVNEFQSLRAQTGRQEGFEGHQMFGIKDRDGDTYYLDIYKSKAEVENAIANAEIYLDEGRAENDQWLVKLPGSGSDVGVAGFSSKAKAESYRAALTAYPGKHSVGVPPAPFVKDTQAWVTLDMKRVIRYAVDNGLDTVTWTTGKQQVGIYTNALRDEIKELKWKKTTDGIEITADGRNVNRTFSDKELRVAAGGAITDQIVNSKEQEGTISGQNIRFEAVWPYSFYGDEKGYGPLNQKEIDALKKAGKPIPESKPSIITAATEKILASIGGGKVESIEVAGIEGHSTARKYTYVGPELSVAELNAIANRSDIPVAHNDIANDVAVYVSQGESFQNALVRMYKMAVDDLRVTGDAHPLPGVIAGFAERIGGGKIEFVGNESSQQPGFRITPEMKKAVLGGFAMFQGEGKRGQISFGEGMGISPTTITLLQNADLSTFLHESGHFYLEVMSHMATQENAAPEIVQDIQRILKWFGVPNADVWNAMTLDEKRPYHEQFARGFESYLFEGTAPSPELKSVFARFRAWMLNVYRQLGSLNVQLTDEVRGVFDRMLASNNEIIAAENQRGFAPLFDDAAKMGASPDEWKNYQEQGTAATQDAVDKLQTRSLRDMKWLSNARSAILKQLQASVARLRKGVRAEVAKEVNAQPIYQAMRWLKFGETTSPEGEAVKATAGFKLDTAALATMYPATALGNPDLSKLGVGKYGMTGAEGLDPNLVAEMFGFGSGDELVRKLIDVEPARSVIEGMTDQRMLERYGDLTSQQAISAAADKAVHNELRARVLATELNALTRATGQKKLLTKAAREFAAAMIARKKLRDIRPAQFESAEARSARATEKALAAGKLVEAATEKRNELVNNYAAKAAHAALDEIAQGVAYLRKVADSKTIDPAYREQITAMLERFDLRQTTLKEAKRKASLLEWMESQKDQGFEPVIDPEIANEAMRMPYQEMTMEQFRGLTDSVRNIEHLGRLKHKLLKLADQREFAKVVDLLSAHVREKAKGKKAYQPIEQNTFSDRVRKDTAEYLVMQRKLASLMREFDGWEDNGEMQRIFVHGANQSSDAEETMHLEASRQLNKMLEPIIENFFEAAGRRTSQLAEGDVLNARKDALRQKMWIPAINQSLSLEGRIMVALNTGNDGNLQRLMDGDHWTKKQVDAVVDTLTKAEMDFVQSIWNFISSYRQQISDQQKRLTGLAPEWVEPRQVVTQHGVYAGGYLPAKYDLTRSTRALADDAAAGIVDQWRGARGSAKTRDSFTKDRASKVVNRPIRKDFGVITQHLTEVIHRLSWQDYLTDAQRLWRSKGLDSAIREHYGATKLEEVRKAFEDIAIGPVPAQDAYERRMNWIRSGAIIAGLGYRLTTSILQLTGFTQSMVRVGSKHIVGGMFEMVGEAAKMESTAKRIAADSVFMRNRMEITGAFHRDIGETMGGVSFENKVLQNSFFYLIGRMQLMVDMPTWLGAYNKAYENNGNNKENAVAQADQAVRDAQGTSQLLDQSRMFRGGVMRKLLTTFGSYFNLTYNLAAESYGRTNFKNPFSFGFFVVDMLLLSVIPALFGTMMMALLHSGDDSPDWDNPDKMLSHILSDQLAYLMGTLVGVREAGGVARTLFGLQGDYQGPASLRLFSYITETGKQIHQGELDEGLWKAAANTGGVLFHVPTGQLSATLDGIVTMAQGKTDNPGALIVGSNRK